MGWQDAPIVDEPTAEAIITLRDGRKAKLTGPSREAIMQQAQKLASADAEGKPWEKYAKKQKPWEKYAAQPKWMSAKVLDEGVDKTPINLPTRQRLIQPSEYERPFELTVPAAGTELAEKGIDVTTGAPTGRAVASFSKDEGYAAQFLTDALSDYYGGDVPVRKGPQSGELEFLNPGTKRWTLVDEAGSAVADFADMTGHAIPVGLGAAGFLLGSVAGPPGEVVASSLLTGIGEAARIKIGERLGANEGITSEEVVSHAAQLAAVEAAFQTGATGAVGLVKFAKQFKSPRPMEASDARIALAQMQKNRQLATDVEALAERPFRPTTGQMSGDDFMLGLQTAYSGNNLQASVQLSRRLNENESALEAAFDHINPVAGDSYIAGRAVVGAVKDRIDPVLGKAEAGLERVTRSVESGIAAVPEIGEQASGRQMRADFLAARDQAKAVEVKAYADYEQAYGLKNAQSNVKIPPSGRFTAHMKDLSAEKINAIFAGQKAGKGQLVSDKLLAKKGDKIQLFGADGKVISEFSKGGDIAIDLHQLEEGIRYLRRVVRKSGTAVAADAPTRDVIRLKDELVTLRNEYLAANNPPLLALAEEAEAAAARRSQDFDKSALAAIMQKKDGQYMLNDTRVFAYVIKSNDQEAAEHFASIVGQDPGAMVAAKQGLWSIYRKEVAPDGVVIPKLHKKFVRDRENVINALFTDAEVNRMRQLGDMGKVVERAQSRYDNLVSGIKRSFGGKIRDTSPENMVSTVFSRNFSAVDARQLTRMLDAGGAGQTFRDGVGTYVRNRVFLNNRLSANSIEKLIAKDGEKLKNIFGPEYVQNLEKIRDGALMIRQTTKGLVPRKTNAFTDLLRVLFAPPLTQRGRAQTLVVNMRYRAAQRAIGEAILDPKKLEAIVRLEETTRTSKRAARVMSALGGYYAFTE